MLRKPDRLALCRAALADEFGRFNAAVAQSDLFIDSPNSLNHGDKVLCMRDDFWLVTEDSGGTHTWAYCNDGRWAELMRRAGVKRNPLFA